MKRANPGNSYRFDASRHGIEIKKIETSKDLIVQPELAKKENDMIIPPLGSSVIICGKSGSGKSTLLVNLLKDSRFYGKSKKFPQGLFQKTFLFSPTANGDDVQKSLGIDPKYVFTDIDEAADIIDCIINAQQGKINHTTADKVDQYLFIFDDIIGETKFMNSKAFTQLFYKIRHVNGTTMLCTQHFKRVPKVCRQQASFIFFFQGMQSEVNTVVEEYAPPTISKRQFEEIVNEATSDKFSFLTINMKLPWQKRFRKNLDEFLVISGADDGQEEEKQTDKKKNKSESFCDQRTSDLSGAVQEAIRHTLDDEDEQGDCEVQQETRGARKRPDVDYIKQSQYDRVRF
jgi:hypothetical protein